MSFNLINKKFKENYKTFDLNFTKENVLEILFKRSKNLNSCNFDFFNDFIDVFTCLHYNNYKDIRVVIIKSSSKHFCSGLDLKETASKILVSDFDNDQARNSLKMKNIIEVMQKSFYLIEDCSIPVIAYVKGYCIGAGIDLILACDIVISDMSSKFSIKEANIGLAADLGTLQRLPLMNMNWGRMNEIVYTGRFFYAKEALELGIISFINKDINDIINGILNNSPIAVQGSKLGINNYKKKIIYKGLEFMKYLNMSLIYTNDIPLSFKKENRIFPKL